VLAMWVPEMPFQMACQQDAGLKDRPLAFLSPGPQRTPCLWLVNRQARAEGALPGEPLDQALHRLPGLRVLDPAPQTWWEAQASLGEFLQTWSPQGLLGRMGEALLDLGGTSRLYGGPEDAADRIQRDLARAMGWTSHGGLSLSATAARLATRAREAKGLHLQAVPEGSERVFLAPYALGHLTDLPPRVRFRFQRLGLARFGDLQPVPLPTLCQLMPEPDARTTLARVRGEDRPRLPMLADPVGESRHPWRLEPPCLPEEAPLASWCLERFWNDGRSPRQLTLRWWDVDGEAHLWKAPAEALAEPPLSLARTVETAFRRLAQRRILVHRLELHLAWGLGRPRALFEGPVLRKLGSLELTLARLRRRYPDAPVLPGWARGERPSA
jgi:hypothetical protein